MGLEVGFADLSNSEKANVLLQSVLDAAKEYFAYSGGDPFYRAGVEHLIQARLFDRILRYRRTADTADSRPPIFCTMQSAARTVLSWLDFPEQNGVLNDAVHVKPYSLFDIVFHVPRPDGLTKRPIGLVGLRKGRDIDAYVRDLVRVCEFSELVNMKGSNRLEFAGVICVDKFIHEAEITLHEMHVRSGLESLLPDSKIECVWRTGALSGQGADGETLFAFAAVAAMEQG